MAFIGPKKELHPLSLFALADRFCISRLMNRVTDAYVAYHAAHDRLLSTRSMEWVYAQTPPESEMPGYVCQILLYPMDQGHQSHFYLRCLTEDIQGLMRLQD